MDTILSRDLLHDSGPSQRRESGGRLPGGRLRHQPGTVAPAMHRTGRDRHTLLHAARRLLRAATPGPLAALAHMLVALYAAARHSIYTGE
jgi:hypothetical protein